MNQRRRAPGIPLLMAVCLSFGAVASVAAGPIDRSSKIAVIEGFALDLNKQEVAIPEVLSSIVSPLARDLENLYGGKAEYYNEVTLNVLAESSDKPHGKEFLKELLKLGEPDGGSKTRGPGEFTHVIFANMRSHGASSDQGRLEIQVAELTNTKAMSRPYNISGSTVDRTWSSSQLDKVRDDVLQKLQNRYEKRRDVKKVHVSCMTPFHPFTGSDITKFEHFAGAMFTIYMVALYDESKVIRDYGYASLLDRSDYDFPGEQMKCGFKIASLEGADVILNGTVEVDVDNNSWYTLNFAVKGTRNSPPPPQKIDIAKFYKRFDPSYVQDRDRSFIKKLWQETLLPKFECELIRKLEEPQKTC